MALSAYVEFTLVYSDTLAVTGAPKISAFVPSTNPYHDIPPHPFSFTSVTYTALAEVQAGILEPLKFESDQNSRGLTLGLRAELPFRDWTGDFSATRGKEESFFAFVRIDEDLLAQRLAGVDAEGNPLPMDTIINPFGNGAGQSPAAMQGLVAPYCGDDPYGANWNFSRQDEFGNSGWKLYAGARNLTNRKFPFVNTDYGVPPWDPRRVDAFFRAWFPDRLLAAVERFDSGGAIPRTRIGHRGDRHGIRGFALPVAAQEAWFPPISDYDTDGEGLEDRKFDALLATLKERLEAEETPADFEREAKISLHEFMRRIMIPELTPEQTAQASDYLTQLAQQRPEHKDLIEQLQISLEHYRFRLECLWLARHLHPGRSKRNALRQ